MSTLFGLVAFVSFVCMFLGLIKPSLFNRLSKKPMTRKRAFATFGGIFVGSLILSAVSASPQPTTNQIVNVDDEAVATNIATNTETTNPISQPSVTTKTNASTPPPQKSEQPEEVTKETKPVEVPAIKVAATFFGNGTFVIGTDIQPGTYRTRTESNNCYYSRLSGFSGALDEIISNANTDAPAIVTIASTDKGFTSTRCRTWTQDLSAITSSQTSFVDGIYFVGIDILPGTYKSSGEENCYYARLSGFSGTIDDIITNENTDTSAIVTIKSSDKGFEATRCGTWTKM